MKKVILSVVILLVMASNSLYGSSETISKDLEKFVLNKLKEYGDSSAYEFNKNKIIKHEIVDVYKFYYQKEETKLVITSTVPIKNFDCTFCAPSISYFIFKKDKLLFSNINIYHSGNYGGFSASIKIIELGEKISAIESSDDYPLHGWSLKNKNLELIIDNKFQSIFQTSLSMDNDAIGYGKKVDYKGTISYYKSNNKLYDIIVHKVGIEDDKKIDRVELYRFNGKKYQIVPQVISKPKTIKEFAYFMMSSKKLVNQDDIIVKHNSKKVKIYCLSDMSVCKTQKEVKE